MKSLPDSIQALVDQAPPPELGPGTPDKNIAEQLENREPTSLFPDRAEVDLDFAKCCLAGLFLKNNQLDPAHVLSQEVDIKEGSFWHGIIHRREGDFGNAKYWFGRVGPHPVMEKLKQEFGADYESPQAFVDACANASDASDLPARRCLEIQQAEWELLFQHCYWSASSAQRP